jgi:release factor glutamine methyltransferase
MTYLDRSTVITMLRTAGCVFAEDEADLLIAEAADPGALATMVDQRVSGLPLEQIVGWADFCGLRIVLEPGVFVPRRRTEFLARQAIALGGDIAIDMCCGSGAIGAALNKAFTEIHAADIDPAAVRCAARNIPGGHVYVGDLFTPLPRSLRERVDVLVANAPYVPTDSVAMMPPEARDFEPMVALDGGADGLDILRRVIAAAPEWLAPGGHLLFETSERQAPHAFDAVAAAGLSPYIESDDEIGATVIVGAR